MFIASIAVPIGMADPKAGLDPNGICICMLGIPNGVGDAPNCPWGAPKGLAKAPKPDIGADDDAEGNPKVPKPPVAPNPPVAPKPDTGAELDIPKVPKVPKPLLLGLKPNGEAPELLLPKDPKEVPPKRLGALEDCPKAPNPPVVAPKVPNAGAEAPNAGAEAPNAGAEAPNASGAEELAPKVPNAGAAADCPKGVGAAPNPNPPAELLGWPKARPKPGAADED
jgi:hypothetical protein